MFNNHHQSIHYICQADRDMSLALNIEDGKTKTKKENKQGGCVTVAYSALPTKIKEQYSTNLSDN